MAYKDKKCVYVHVCVCVWWCVCVCVWGGVILSSLFRLIVTLMYTVHYTLDLSHPLFGFYYTCNQNLKASEEGDMYTSVKLQLQSMGCKYNLMNLDLI